MDLDLTFRRLTLESIELAHCRNVLDTLAIMIPGAMEDDILRETQERLSELESLLGPSPVLSRLLKAMSQICQFDDLEFMARIVGMTLGPVFSLTLLPEEREAILELARACPGDERDELLEAPFEYIVAWWIENRIMALLDG